MSTLPQTDSASVAVVTGGHAYDVPGFHALFRNLSGADCYIQHMEDFVSDAGQVRQDYDVVLFYNMPGGAPQPELEGYQGRIAGVLEELGSRSQGVFVLHHGILAYPDWPFWSDLIGMVERSFTFHHDEQLHVEIAQHDHPITAGLSAWEMVDETYVMAEPAADNDILLTVDHPRSTKAIAWSRTFRQAPVFCFQSGHDNKTYANPHFRRIVERGIQWCAGRL